MDKKDQFEFLDSGFNSISTVVVITDRHWQIMMANPSAKKLFRQRLGTQQPENLRPLFGHTSFLDNVSERIAADEMVDFLLCNDQFQPDTSNPVWMVNFDPIDSEKSPFNFRVITIVDFKVLGEEIKRRREAEAEFRAVFDNAFHFLALLDPDGRIIQANRTALKLLEVPEDMNLVGSKFVESPFFFQQDSQKIREAVDSALKDNIYRGVLTVHSLSGRLIYVDSVFYSIRNRDHEVQYILAEGVDVTDRLAAEQEQEKLRSQVQHSQKLESLGILAGGIAHDFNNLLMGILGHADLASLKVPPSSPALNNLHEIESTARRAADLCRQMLAYSGKGKFVVEAIDLNLIIADMRQLLAVSVNKSSTLKYHLSEELPLMEGDASQIGQIILNLVMNASEAIGQKDGIITIATGAKYCDQSFFESNQIQFNSDPGVYIYLEVSDTGSGMDQATIERIFDPFFTTKFTGRGLGLAAVLGIVKGHRGCIKIYSELDKGSTCKLLFPVSDNQQVQVLKLSNQETEEFWRGRGTALIVDDEEAVLALGQEMLQLCGFEVLSAKNGVEALEIYRREHDRIECIVLDLTMPTLGGEATFRELRRINPNVKVIMSSGYNEQEVTQNFVGKGLAGFIQKPYQLSELKAKLKDIFAESDC